MLEQKIELKNVDIEAAAKYIAANCTRQEIYQSGLSKVIPNRKHKKGCTPGVTNSEIYQSISKNLNKSNRQRKKEASKKHSDIRRHLKEAKKVEPTEQGRQYRLKTNWSGSQDSHG